MKHHVRNLALQHVSVGYPATSPVLRDVNMTMTPGRRLALVGANGTGKTTLLRTLSGALRPLSGQVLVDTEPLRYTRRSLAQYRQDVQLVLQDPDDQLFSADVYADVSFGPSNLGLPKPEVQRRVESTLALLEISNLTTRPIHQLSAGERQRVAIAGAVAMAPRFLLLDEPTAGLDSAGVDALRACLTKLESTGTTIVMASHDLALIWEWAEDVALIDAEGVHRDQTARVLCDFDRLHKAGLRQPWQAEILTRLQYPWATTPPRTAAEIADVIRLRDDYSPTQ
ncbi:MAG: energy-coupling factor ABC transporter ATP-binding protein [Actinomycetota bacterium]